MKFKATLEYYQYLSKHIKGVRRVFDTIMLPILENEKVSQGEIDSIREVIESHDRSKYDESEFKAYRNHYYYPKKYPRSHDKDYNLAWLHHQNHNPHHWQYWCLINDVDEPQVEAIDMPFKYIIEMLCDWQSAGNHYGNTAYEWYEKQKDKMILSENTRKTVEKYIEYFK